MKNENDTMSLLRLERDEKNSKDFLEITLS